MKHLILGAAFAVGLVGAATAEPVLGTWQTEKDDNGHYGYILVEPCGPKICGTLVKAFDASGTQIASDNIGKKIIWDMEPTGDGTYGNGKVWSPDRDKTYNSKMQLTGDDLAVQGCVLIVCRDGGNWRRVN